MLNDLWVTAELFCQFLSLNAILIQVRVSDDCSSLSLTTWIQPRKDGNGLSSLCHTVKNGTLNGNYSLTVSATCFFECHTIVTSCLQCSMQIILNIMSLKNSNQLEFSFSNFMKNLKILFTFYASEFVIKPHLLLCVSSLIDICDRMGGSTILSVIYGYDVGAVQNSAHTENAEQGADGFMQTFMPGSFLVVSFTLSCSLSFVIYCVRPGLHTVDEIYPFMVSWCIFPVSGSDLERSHGEIITWTVRWNEKFREHHELWLLS